MDNQENTTKTQLEKLKERIPYNESLHGEDKNYTSMLNSLLEDSLYIGLSLKYPFDEEKDTLPKRYDNWQIRCCLELYKLAGNENIKSYKENGLEWTMFRDGLSTKLVHEIIPRVGLPKEVDENEV